jgi:hypothetical protein
LFWKEGQDKGQEEAEEELLLGVIMELDVVVHPQVLLQLQEFVIL